MDDGDWPPSREGIGIDDGDRPPSPAGIDIDDESAPGGLENREDKLTAQRLGGDRPPSPARIDIDDGSAPGLENREDKLTAQRPGGDRPPSPAGIDIDDGSAPGLENKEDKLTAHRGDDVVINMKLLRAESLRCRSEVLKEVAQDSRKIADAAVRTAKVARASAVAASSAAANARFLRAVRAQLTGSPVIASLFVGGSLVGAGAGIGTGVVRNIDPQIAGFVGMAGTSLGLPAMMWLTSRLVVARLEQRAADQARDFGLLAHEQADDALAQIQTARDLAPPDDRLIGDLQAASAIVEQARTIVDAGDEDLRDIFLRPPPART
jgi:hypothetical protein